MNRVEMIERLKSGESPIDVSIKKWKDIIDGKGEDDGIENCALCYIFYSSEEQCEECPIAQLVESNHCKKTPLVDEGDEREELKFLKLVKSLWEG